MTTSLQVRILILSREISVHLLNLNELDEKSRTTNIFGNFVNKP